MKNFVIESNQRFVLTIAFVFSTIVSFGQSEGWHIYKNPPEILTPLKMESTNDGTLYILSKDLDMYYREVGDDAWTLIENTFLTWRIRTFAVHPVTKRLFVGTWSDGIQMTDDYGETWQHEYFFTDPIYGHQGIQTIEIDVENEMIICSGRKTQVAYEFEMYRSFNGGNSWQTIIAPQGTFQMHIMGENRILASAGPPGLLFSDDNGLTWMLLGSLGVNVGDFAEDENGTIYAAVPDSYAAFDHGVYVSNDEGLTWTINNTGLGNTEVTCVAYNAINNEVIVGTFDGLYRLNDQMWEIIDFPYVNPGLQDIHLIDSAIYLCSEQGGVSAKELDQNSWNPYNLGLQGGATEILFGNNGTLYATNNLKAGYFGVVEPLQNWERRSLPAESAGWHQRIKKMEKAPSGDIYFMGYDELFRSSDDGSTFINITPDIPIMPFNNFGGYYLLDVNVQDQILLYEYADTMAYISTDNGLSFQVLIDPSDVLQGISMIYVLLNSNTLGYLAVVADNYAYQRLMRSVDGESWVEIETPQSTTGNSNLGFSLDLMSNGQVIFSRGLQPYFFNADNSFTEIVVPWSQLTNSGTSYDYRSDANGVIYISRFKTNGYTTEYDGVWKSDDVGQSWTNLGFPTTQSGQMIYSNLNFNLANVPFIITEEKVASIYSHEKSVGIFYYGEEGVFTNLEDLNGSGQEILVYPNPVSPNGILTIENIVINKNTTFACFDVHGREVNMMATVGNKLATLSLGSLAKGVYFLSLLNANEIHIVKFVVR